MKLDMEENIKNTDRADYLKSYYEANKDRIKAYYEANKDRIKAYREANKDRIKANRKAYHEANKDRIKAYREANKDRIKAYKYVIKKDKWYSILYSSCKQTNRKNSESIDFDSNYLLELFEKQNGLCGYFKIPLITTTQNKHPFKPSIDRKDNTKGYSKDNIVLCSLMANLGRNDCDYDTWIKCLETLDIKSKC